MKRFSLLRSRRQSCVTPAGGCHGPILLAVGALFLCGGCVNVFVFHEPVTALGNGAWRSNAGIGTNIVNNIEGGAAPQLTVPVSATP